MCMCIRLFKVEIQLLIKWMWGEFPFPLGMACYEKKVKSEWKAICDAEISSVIKCGERGIHLGQSKYWVLGTEMNETNHLQHVTTIIEILNFAESSYLSIILTQHIAFIAVIYVWQV